MAVQRAASAARMTSAKILMLVAGAQRRVSFMVARTSHRRDEADAGRRRHDGYGNDVIKEQKLSTHEVD